MEINGNLYVKVDDEQLDEIVVKHCQAALDACTSVLEFESIAVMDKSCEDAQHHIDTITHYENYASALRIVIKFFGGEPIDTSENVFRTETANASTDCST
jgi:hypothetical protein